MSDSSALLRVRQTIRQSPVAWAQACHITLRPYQKQIIRAVKNSIINNLGLTFVVILPRQSGKNEIQAHLFAWLLFRSAQTGGRIVSVSPTFKPQTENNMVRVKFSLDACIGLRGLWQSSKGYVYQFGQARLQFFSGEPRAKVVGATADLLLSVDEAQEVSIAKFDKDFDPMTASTNATRVFWGTAWTANTLLDRERRTALRSQQQDGLQRLFFFTADDVSAILPAYALHVERVIAEHGRNHPRVRSQYFCETIDAQSGMFTPARLAMIISPSSSPPPSGEGPGVGSVPSSFLLDIAGMDESKLNPLNSPDFGLGNPGRDSTALSIVQIDMSTVAALGHPTYHVVARYSWIGDNHLTNFGRLKALAETWHPQHIVMDATGVGEGMWALVDKAFPSRVIPVKFTQQEKSEIGWRFLSIIESGRFRDHVHTDEVRLQYTHCISEVLPGPLKPLRWGVPDGTRGPDGELIHDDFILADALCVKLDQLDWYIPTTPMIVPARDPLPEMEHNFGGGDYDHSFGAGSYDRSFGTDESSRFFRNRENVRYYK